MWIHSPIGDARGQYVCNIDSGRTNFILFVHRVALQRRIIAQNNSEFIVHGPFDFDQQRSQWKFNRLHHRNIVFDGQIGQTADVATFENLLSFQQRFIDQRNLQSSDMQFIRRCRLASACKFTHIVDAQQSITRFNSTDFEYRPMWSYIGHDQWKFAASA